MSKLFKKDDEKPPVEKQAPPPEDGCVECGKPKAPGQSYLCADHIRRD